MTEFKKQVFPIFRRPQRPSAVSSSFLSEMELVANDLLKESESGCDRPLVIRVGVGGNVLRIALLRNCNGKTKK